jgi:iron complex outermembrane receptor protein
MFRPTTRAWLAISTCVLALTAGGLAWAADGAAADGTSPTGSAAGQGSEGTDVSELIVTAEKTQAAAAAPTKATVDAFQPQSIISHKYIEAFTPENGDYTTVVLIAPSVSGVPSNGGGFGDTNKATLRGFHDGQYNLTYDSIAFGDTNDPTHHPNDYFPPSMIGAAVVDRGPGQAGDIGQANYGGAIHLFSPTVADVFGVDQKISYGSFGSFQAVSALQTGAIARTGGTKILAIFDTRSSNGELSNMGGIAFNSLVKIVQPIGSHASLTLFSSVEYTRFFESDANLGETWQQYLLYGPNFALNNDPNSEFCKCYNTEKKHTDFEYVNFKDEFGDGFSVDDFGYTYFYSNKTISVDDNSGIIGGPNTSHPKDKHYNQADIGGYNKGNRYRVFGNIFRLNKDWSWGTLKLGGLYEVSSTDRHNILYDLTTGAPDYNAKYAILPPPAPPNNNYIKTLEFSHWHQYQLFADFEIRPTSQLTITPGIKYVHFTRDVDGVVENSLQGAQTRATIIGSNTYTQPLYFVTANYKIFPFWSVYAQYATGFLIPSLSALYADNLQLNNLKPSKTVNYQAGTVYSRGHFTADADVYRISVSNLEIPSPNGQFFINSGNALYSGVEGEAAYAFDFGLTLFANGSINTAKNTTADQTELNAPKWTDAAGLLFTHRQWQASLIWKQVGRQVVYDNGGAPFVNAQGVLLAPNQEVEIPAYSTVNASIGYDFGRFKVKLAATNLFDHRSITSVTGPSFNGDFYTFEAGRSIIGTIEARFP